MVKDGSGSGGAERMTSRLKQLWDRWNWLAHHLAAFIICLSAYTSNTFGLKTLTESVSAATLNSVLSSFYPSKRRDDIVVVLITDSDIDQFDDRFPVTYFLHQMALNAIASMKPKAVLVDFVFAREQAASDRSNTDEFTQFLREYPAPLFMASSTRTEIRPQGVHPKFEVGTLVTVPKYVNIAMQNAYCFTFASRASADGSSSSGCVRQEAPDARPTAAYALYRFMCSGDAPDSRCPGNAIEARTRGNYFRVMWGSTPSQLFDFLPGRPPCRTTSFLEMYQGAADVTAADCPYHAQISLTDLLTASNDRALRTKLQDAMRNKIVMYGGFIGPNLDLVRPPTVRGVAGVHFHAMGLDNLLAFGNSYKADVAIIGGGHITGSNVNLAFFLIAYALTLFKDYRAQSRESSGNPPDVWQFVLRWSVGVCYILFCGLSFLWLDLAPSNWLGAALTTVVLPNIIKRYLGVLEVYFGRARDWISARRLAKIHSR